MYIYIYMCVCVCVCVCVYVYSFSDSLIDYCKILVYIIGPRGSLLPFDLGNWSCGLVTGF